ncbi:hypothetical protein ACQ7RL_000856 [Photobacterium damselae]
MNIDISDDIIKDNSKLSELYEQLVAFKSKHRLSYQAYIMIRDSIYVSNADKRRFKTIFEATSNLIKFKKRIKVVSQDPHDNEVALVDLNDVLSSRAYVILENEHQDLDFLFTCIDAVDEGPKLNKYYNRMWTARGAGGCGDIPKLISKCNHEQMQVPRILVVNDSDKYHPSHNIDIAQNNIILRVNEMKVEHVMLNKREIENYIPIYVLEDIYGDKYPKIIAIKIWSKEQRDYFDMKKGFHKKCPYNDIRYNNIYHNLDSKHQKLFSSGFGEDISKTAFNSKMRNLYTKNNLNSEDISIYPEFLEIKNKLLSIL